MSIKSMDETGFVVSTAHRGKNIADIRVEYRECGVPCDEHGVPLNGHRVDFLCYLIRRAWTENLNNAAQANGKQATFTQAAEALMAKVDSMRKGEIATGGGGPRLSQWEVEKRAVVGRWFVAKGMATKKADELARVPIEEAASVAVTAIFEGQGSPDVLATRWKAEIDRRVKAMESFDDSGFEA